MEVNIINLFIFIICFISWLILVIKNKYKWYTNVLAFLWGAFLCQTILGVIGLPTVVGLIMK